MNKSLSQAFLDKKHVVNVIYKCQSDLQISSSQFFYEFNL